MSLDDYPIFDLVERSRRPYKKVGAASLLYCNHDELWPEFGSRDLCHSGYREFQLLAQDLARMPDVLGNQLPHVYPDADLITLTIGGNDLLHTLANCETSEDIARESTRLQKEYEWLVDRIQQHAPRATLVCTSIYDPSDGTGVLRKNEPPVPIQYLDELNNTIAKVCESRRSMKFADVAKHFRGHGLDAIGEDRWFWSGGVIDPSARGASEVRRAWLETLGL